MTKKMDFKATASSIFKDVLADTPSSDAHLHKDGIVHTHNSESVKKDMVLSRLHVFISSELENKLLDEVIRRKKDRSAPQKLANKRAVVEQALEQFL